MIRRSTLGVIPFGLAFVTLSAIDQAAVAMPTSEPSMSAARASSNWFAFVENRGQWDTPARFVASSPREVLRIEDDGIWWQTRRAAPYEEIGTAIHLTFPGAMPTPARGEGSLSGLYNYYLGSDAACWRAGVRSWERIVYPELWPGIDLVVRSNGGCFEYDLVVCAGAKLSDAVIHVDGADQLDISPSGALRVHTAHGILEQTVPTVLVATSNPTAGASPTPAAPFRLLGPTAFTFDTPAGLADYVVDPGLIWSSYFGGASNDSGGLVRCLADSGGIVTLCGATESSDFPHSPGSFAFSGGVDGFVSKIDTSSNTLIFSTFLGGNTDDYCFDLDRSPDGTIVVVGEAQSDNFPVTPGVIDDTANDNPLISDGFVTKLQASTGALTKSTYVGGLFDDDLRVVYVLPDAQILTIGDLTDFPTTPGTFGSVLGPGFRLTKIRADLSTVVFSTNFGGNGILDLAGAIAVQQDGTIVLAGSTNSTDLPAAQLGYDSDLDDSVSSIFEDAFVARVAADASVVYSSTYLGGAFDDGASPLCIDAFDRVLVVGNTLSTDFPVTPGAVQPIHRGIGSGFVAVLASDLSDLLASTFWGAPDDFGLDSPRDVVCDSSGLLTLVGATETNVGFPVTSGAFQEGYGYEGYVTRLSPALDHVLYSTCLGGNQFGSESLSGVALLPLGAVATVGTTAETDFPVTPNAPQPNIAGQNDKTISILDLLPTGVSAFGASTPSCMGEIIAGADSLPAAGSTAFNLYSSSAPPGALGFLGIGVGQVPTGVPIFGITIFLDLSLPIVLQPVAADANGFLLHSLPLPAGTAGQTVYAQFAWLDAPGCTTPQGLSSSHALAITIQ